MSEWIEKFLSHSIDLVKQYAASFGGSRVVAKQMMMSNSVHFTHVTRVDHHLFPLVRTLHNSQFTCAWPYRSWRDNDSIRLHIKWPLNMIIFVIILLKLYIAIKSYLFPLFIIAVSMYKSFLSVKFGLSHFCLDFFWIWLWYRIFLASFKTPMFFPSFS